MSYQSDFNPGEPFTGEMLDRDGPALTIRAEGLHDVSRLVQALAEGNSGQARLARTVADTMLDSGPGTATLVLLARHGGVDLTRGVTVAPEDRAACPRCGDAWRAGPLEALAGGERCAVCAGVGVDPHTLVDFDAGGVQPGGIDAAWESDDGDYVVIGAHLTPARMRVSIAAQLARAGVDLDADWSPIDEPVVHAWATQDPIRSEINGDTWWWFHSDETADSVPVTLSGNFTPPVSAADRLWVWCPGAGDQAGHGVAPDEVTGPEGVCDNCVADLEDPAAAAACPDCGASRRAITVETPDGVMAPMWECPTDGRATRLARALR